MELKYNSLGAGTGQAFRLQGQAVHTQLQKLALSVKWKSDPLREAFKKNYEGSDTGRTPFPFKPLPPSNGGDNKISKI